jgi:hypothetical protein
MFLESMAKAQDSALFRQAGMLFELGKFSIQEEGFFHVMIGQGKSLLHEVDTQHGFQ